MSHFILLLSGKTISYDKLGFLILYENKKMFNKIMILYIICILRDLNDEKLDYQKKFFVFSPNNERFHYFLKDKLNRKYNILKEFNLYI